MRDANTLLSVCDLVVSMAANPAVRPVNGVSLELHRGEAVGIVGESGAGKTVLALSLMGLLPAALHASGEVTFNGRRLLSIPEREWQRVRGRQIGMVFQDPLTSLNPYLRISTQLMEMTRLHLGHNRRQAFEHAVKMLELVGLPDVADRAREYPHQFSGGMRQRAAIAMALSCRPALLIADEPTTALDVTIQVQILELLAKLRSEIDTAVLLITHDLSVVAGSTDRVIVLYAGQVFESAPTTDLFREPRNPYTRALLKCTPQAGRESDWLFQLPGLPADAGHIRPGQCPFAARCPEAMPRCFEASPPLRHNGARVSRCWRE